MKHFKIYEHLQTWREKSNEFIEKLRNEKALSINKTEEITIHFYISIG